ncbi:MAG TPA: DUF1259 domain-containing protein [Thermoanaerobaculia bacterium]|jgi:hypothetical protein|nr:DUF1259 domain-containing protein [Thermoanaerobaculia bacterium]
MKFKTFVLTLTLALLTALSLSAQEAADPAWKAVDAVFGTTGKDLAGGVHRFGWPRRDLHVQVGGVPVQPALALGSWGAFLKEGNQTMTMGDLVLLESELTPVVAALEAGGIEISAIHNHLVNESPHVIYVHFSGHGEPTALARTLKGALGHTQTPMSSPAAPAQPTAADEQAFKTVQAVLGKTGTLAGTVLQVGVPRAERIAEKGMEVPPSMGMANALNFQRAGDRVATTGDFVLLASEVNPVIRELQAHGIAVTALHSHMLEETPRLFFMHFWGVDTPEKIAGALKAALARVNTK